MRYGIKSLTMDDIARELGISILDEAGLRALLLQA